MTSTASCRKFPTATCCSSPATSCRSANHDLDFQAEWLDTEFRFWLKSLPARQIVFVAGNHDLVFEQAAFLVPKDLPAVYLQDSGFEWQGLKIWGTPWQPWFFDWAFNLREPELKAKWDLIPDDTDILVVHGPPFGYGDGVPRRDSIRQTGSPSLLERIKAISPKLVVFGHIHEGRGDMANRGNGPGERHAGERAVRAGLQAVGVPHRIAGNVIVLLSGLFSQWAMMTLTPLPLLESFGDKPCGG